MAGAKRKPKGRVIEVQIATATGSAVMVDKGPRGQKETRQWAAEEFIEKHAPALPPSIGPIVIDCVRRGIRSGQGRKGRGFLSQTAKFARETAYKEARERLWPQYRIQAKAEGRPPRWAREQTAEATRQRMLELGDDKPPSVEAILKRGFADQVAT